MKAFQAGYADLTKRNATLLVVSADDVETMRAFKNKLGADYGFIADPKAELIDRFGVKMFLFGVAKRYTFVVGRGRRILKVVSGTKAIVAKTAIKACDGYDRVRESSLPSSIIVDE